MPVGSKPGERRGGRQKGTKNKVNSEVAERLAGLGCDPVEGMARIALRQCECPTCEGLLKAKYTVGAFGVYLDPDAGQEGTCRTCWGTGKEPITPELRGKMFAELIQYIAPKLKAVEHSGPDGGAQQHEHVHRIDLSEYSDEELEAAELLGRRS